MIQQSRVPTRLPTAPFLVMMMICLPKKVIEYLTAVLKCSFKKYDVDDDGTLEFSEIKMFFRDFHEHATDDNVKALFRKYDTNSDGNINFDEFVLGCYSFLKASRRGTNVDARVENNPEAIVATSAVDQALADDEEEEELPEEIAVRVNISPFYVSFVLAPLASNASEVIASQYYAAKKTTKTITVSLSALQGAACMNNTFCLAIFMGLIYFRGLAWQYTAETVSIVLVQVIIFAMTREETMTRSQGLIIMACFPLSIAFVAGLEAVGFD